MRAGKTSTIVLNEVTTAATVIALGQFMGTTLGAGTVPQIGATCNGCATGTYNQGLVNAFSNTYPQLVDNSTGKALASGTSGSITITREDSKLNTIANVLAACVNSNGATSTTETTSNCGALFTDVNEPGATRPSDTVQAALMMDLYPWYNVSAAYGLAVANSPFIGLSTTPNDWTVAISYAYPDMSVGISGTSIWHSNMNLDIDAGGRIWFPSTQSGAVGVGYFDPSSTTFSGPYNSSGSPLVHPQFVAIDTVGYVWLTDMEATNIEGFSTISPSSSPTVLNAGHSPMGAIGVGPGDTMYAMTGIPAGVHLVTISSNRASLTVNIQTGGTGATGSGFVASGYGWGYFGAQQFTHSGGTSGGTDDACFIASPYNSPQAIKISTTTPCTSGGLGTYHASGSYTSNVIAVATTTGQFGSNNISYYTPALAMSSPEGVAVDGNNQVWVANAGNSSITTYGFPYSVVYTAQVTQTATVPYLHDATHGNTLTNPYALGIDGSGNVWTISPGCVSGATACTPNGMVLTNLVGAAAPTITPLGVQIVNTTMGTKPTS